MARLKIGIVVIGGALLAAGIAGAAETITYTYDAKGRLVKVVHTGTANNNLTTNFTFDDADNRKTVVVTGSPNSSP